MNKADKEKAAKRNIALYRCNQFDCKKARESCQCCNYCVKEAGCEEKCLNNSEQCGRFYVASELYWSLPEEARGSHAVRTKKMGAPGGVRHAVEKR